MTLLVKPQSMISQPNRSAGSGIVPFVFEFLTTGADESVALPLISTGTYDFDVDWGDGNTDTITTYNQAEVTHTYATADTYTVSITGVIKGWSFLFSAGAHKTKVRDLSSFGCLELFSNASGGNHAFYSCTNMTISATDAPTISGASSINMFWLCTSITTIPGIEQFDFSNITNQAAAVTSMFKQCINFNQDLSGWDLSGVTSFAAMFEQADAFNSPMFSIPSSATSLFQMFYNTNVFNQTVPGDTSNVTDFSYMFSGAAAFNSSLSNFDMTSATNIARMFEGATAFNQDVSFMSDPGATALTNMQNVFKNATAFNQSVANIPTGSVTSFGGCFENAAAFNQSLSTWDFGSVTSMTTFLDGATSFSTANYDQLLIDCDTDGQSNVTLDAGPCTYTGFPSAAFDAQVSLSGKGWTITDSGAA